MALRTCWYGKLATVGDFASRRLPPPPLEALDHWLANGLAGWREREPALWLEQYLTGPPWRFAWPAGTLPGIGALAGVLMPSVDRVGRYFPLALLHPLPHPLSPEGMGWLHRLSDLALDALHDDWTIEQLEDALARLDASIPLAEDSPPKHLVWWCANADGALRWHHTDQLPTGTDFDALLAGRVGTFEPSGEHHE